MRRRFWMMLVVGIALLLPYSLKAQDRFHLGHPSLYTDIKARRVGDLVTILIFEDASAENESNTETQKEATYDVSGGPGIWPLDFIPLFGVSGDGQSEYKGAGATDRATRLRARMTARITGLTPGGDLVVEGRRVIGVNDDREALTLTGIVRPADVTADNTVASYLIADAKIIYTGRGPAGTGSRPGLIIRLLNWLF